MIDKKNLSLQSTVHSPNHNPQQYLRSIQEDCLSYRSSKSDRSQEWDHLGGVESSNYYSVFRPKTSNNQFSVCLVFKNRTIGLSCSNLDMVQCELQKIISDAQMDDLTKCGLRVVIINQLAERDSSFNNLLGKSLQTYEKKKMSLMQEMFTL